MKRTIKILVLSSLVWFVSNAIQGQNVTSSAGGQFQNPSYKIDWTLGESFIQTSNIGMYKVTAGFHQPELLVTKIPEAVVSTSIVSVYPNPAHDKLTISRIGGLQLNSTAWLYDGSGRLIAREDLTGNESILSMTALPAGNYTLIVEINNTENHQFKIIKILK